MNPEGFAEFGKFKETTDLLFPNLPYLIDGDVKMSETIAILRFNFSPLFLLCIDIVICTS